MELISLFEDETKRMQFKGDYKLRPITTLFQSTKCQGDRSREDEFLP